MRYLLDTNAIGDYVDNRFGVHDKAKAVVAGGGRLGISVPVLAEIVSGLELSETRDQNFLKFDKAMKTLALWPFDEDAAYMFGKIYADLQRRGKIIGKMDIMIAATAFVLAPCTIVTTDSDFQSIPGLLIENWRTSAS